MSFPRKFVRRSVSGALAASALYLGPAAATASAHVEASSSDAVRGGVALVSFQVPNESTTGAATTALAVDLTGVSAVRTEAKAGWSAKLDRDSSGAVRSVTWTAAPNGGIAVDQFGVFRISAKLPDADTVSFPATQTYGDGVVVKWEQSSAPGEAEPEHPAPTLVVAGSTPLRPIPANPLFRPRPLDMASRPPTTPPACWPVPPFCSAPSASPRH